MIGMERMSIFCVLSVCVASMSSVEMSWVTTYKTSKMYVGSGKPRWGIQRKLAWSESLDGGLILGARRVGRVP